MKRSRSIRLVLIGALSAGTLTSCAPGDPAKATISSQSVYTNDFYVPGVGYYHAPFRAFYPLRYNYFDPQSQRYFFGGRWAAAPHASVTNISAPLPNVAQQAEAQRTDIPRGGFGRSSHTYHVWS